MPAAEYLAHARAGLIGNPSDGYNGKTISFIVRNFAARVTIEDSHAIEIVPNDRDHSQFESMLQLRQDVRRYGYYGGVRLLKAACKVFGDYCESQHIDLPKRNFRLSYRSDIPDHVGLAGSSAIITACFRALMGFYSVSIPRETLPGLILSAEKTELKIPAGLQDRVIQVYEGVVFMDFAREHMDQHGHGFYEELDPALLPPLYIAYSTELSEGTEVFHNDMRARYDRGDPHVRSAIQRWAHLAEQTKFMLLRRQTRSIPPLLDENFDLRRSICPLNPGHVRMIETARSVGVSAKFTGSGGAIVGICDDEPTFQRLSEAMDPLSVKVIRPQIT
jgi:glucuronokinase